MAISIASLEALGCLFQPPRGNMFHLDRRDTVSIVIEGRLDLFVCTRSSSGDLGARRHFLRIEEGDAAFGIEFEQADRVLVAVAVPSTRLLLLSLDTMRNQIAREDSRAQELVERWITAVAARSCTRKLPLSFIDACATSVISIPEEDKAVVASEGIRWVRHARGESVPLGDERFPKVNGTGYFPVTRFGWLHASSGSELHVISTSAAADADQAWEGLHAFHALIDRLVQAESTELLEFERDRIRQRSSLDSTLLENALRRLTTPIRKSRVWHDEDRPCTHPVFLAFQMVAAELGIKLTPPAAMLQNAVITDPVGLIAKTSSVRIRKVALKGEWPRALSGPLLCFLEEDQRPVAVLVGRSSRAEVYDPLTQSIAPLDDDLALKISPLAHTLYRAFPSRAINGLDLIKFGLKRCRGDLVLVALSGIAIGALAIVNPFITGVIFDRIIPGAERNQLYQMTALMLVVAVASSLFTMVRGFAVIRLQGRMDADLQAALWDRLLALPVPFFRGFTAGDLAQRSMGIAVIREILTGSVLNAVLSAIFSLFSFALLFYYSVPLAFIAAGLVTIACLFSVAVSAVQLRHGREVQRISGELSSSLLQFVSGIAKFKVSGTERRAFAAWAREFARQKQESVSARKVSNLLAVFNSVFPTASLIIIFFANSHLATTAGKNQLTTGDFLAFLAAFTQFMMATLALSGTATNVLGIIPVYERTKPILQSIPEGSQAKSAPGLLNGDIEISHVSFSYRPDSPLVLRQITLRIKAGQAVAFVGASGCGKSTLFRMLLGFERPTSGTVYYDGQDLAGLDIQAVRRQIGVVLQTSRPVSGSIFDNIVGSAPLTLDDAWEACRMAGLDEDIKRMPMGLHTNLSDGGAGISGGQRQRLMIARAIVGKPRILLFDEATSALDNRTQAVVSRSLAGLRATRIVIAHRLSTVVNMDNIFVLDRGTVAESGTYAHLMAQKGLFYELAKRQLAEPN